MMDPIGTQPHNMGYGVPHPGTHGMPHPGTHPAMAPGSRGAVYAAPPQHHTTVVVSQPSSAHTPHRMQMQERDWGSNICSCCDDVLGCCLAYFCPCCFSCYIACRLEECCLVPIVVPGGETAMRTKLRVQNGIRGSIMNDCFTMYLCYCCALAQMGRELNATTRGGRVI
ncbi:cornifelin-like [Amphiura filiformis]|uniref:cornifelin-like n=1 Tax=Amphiura filiformis TaxID=82378 RepID=UPI003B21F47F